MPHRRVLCIGLLCPHTFCMTWCGVSACPPKVHSLPATALCSHGSLHHRGLADAPGGTEPGGTGVLGMRDPLEVVFSILLCWEGFILLKV